MKTGALIYYVFVLLSLELYPARVSNRDYIWKVYNIDLPAEVNIKSNVRIFNNHTVVCLIKKRRVEQLLSKQIPGYSAWRKVSPEESYGNRDILIDGFVERSLFEAHRVVNGSQQQIIVDVSSGRVVLINI